MLKIVFEVLRFRFSPRVINTIRMLRLQQFRFRYCFMFASNFRKKNLWLCFFCLHKVETLSALCVDVRRRRRRWRWRRCNTWRCTNIVQIRIFMGPFHKGLNDPFRRSFSLKRGFSVIFIMWFHKIYNGILFPYEVGSFHYEVESFR